MSKNAMIKWIFGSLGLLGVAFGLFYGAWLYGPGSYPRAETYTIEASEEAVIRGIDQFKMSHPSYRVPIFLPGGRINSEYEYVVYFYYPEEDKILFTFTRPVGKSRTTFSLVRLNDGLDLGRWRDVNDEFWGSSENSEIIETFEERILNPIVSIIKSDSTPTRQ